MALAALLLGVMLVMPAAGRVEAEPPKSFNLWVGRWDTPYGVLTLKPTTAAVPPDTVKRPAVTGAFSGGGTLLGRLNFNRGDAGDLSNTVVTGNYRLPNAGAGQFRMDIDTSEGSTTAFRAFTFNAFGGQASTFTAPYAGGGPEIADLKRSFKATGPFIHREAGRVYYIVRWYYEATLLGPSALPKPGLILRFRYSRPISPLHLALGPPNVPGPPVRHIWICNEVQNAARSAKLGFNCETFSLGVRHGQGNGWLVRASFSATVPAGSGPISATISNTETDRFARLPAADRTPLRAGKKIPGGGTGPPSSTTVTVPGNANVFAAGRASPPAFAGGGGVLPPAISLSRQGLHVQIRSARGTVSCCGPNSAASPADGSPGRTDIRSSGGISGIVVGRAMFLSGVFTGDAISPTAPPRLAFPADVTTATLRPKLQQTFYIGDGRTSAGAIQTIVAPPGATRLYLGIADAFSFLGDPGWYQDNGGRFTVTVRAFRPSR